ncbi:GH39 family glycosyl hydrolase [Jiangella asiatica]|uniref:Xylan 1,4-beta-xylosidase n=1 Tax=Jiangella asiatica TaxID=2530372 RepID=A0A4R5CVU0_9ACTN|nr:xylan 1,4-beta-xylosidase [Jiangella asiatica]TDE02005.1 xylan 1,4-beta-xylosidase [Jiangella asiatica]
MSRETTARSDFETRLGRVSGAAARTAVRLPAPAGLSARPGRGQVTLAWESVDGAAGYLVHVASSPDGPFEPLDHLGRDVLAVPHGPYVDTTGAPGEVRWYAVAAVPDVDQVGELSAPVSAASLPGAGGPDSTSEPVTVVVDAAGDDGELDRPWRLMIGSEHLSHALSADRTGGQEIGAELRAALRAAHDELGVRMVRAHAILGDDLGVYREVDGEPVHDFSGVDRVYDMVLSLGLKPVVEISFMPRDLASDPSATVFEYGAIISPPKDWGHWYDLVRAFVAHLVDRYGLDEVRDEWAFEIWNEANLEVFWSGSPEEFFRLHEVATRAVKDVDPQLRVGGPASAAAGWIDQLLAHTEAAGIPPDFVSTHTYGSPPLDLRPILERHGRDGIPIWWTEWGVTPTHFNEVSESVFAAVFLLRGMRSAMDRLESLSYWVVSDHFEELGRPPALFHGGFGLRTVGELRKPRWWALAMLEALPSRRLPATLSGDGADSLVEGLAAASREADGRVAALVWNGTLDQSKASGSTMLGRRIELRFTGLPDGDYELRHHRVDDDHSCVPAVWRRIGAGADWPTREQWEQLRAADRLDELHPPRRVRATGGVVEIEFDLPNPSMSLVELIPVAG